MTAVKYSCILVNMPDKLKSINSNKLSRCFTKSFGHGKLVQLVPVNRKYNLTYSIVAFRLPVSIPILLKYRVLSNIGIDRS